MFLSEVRYYWLEKTYSILAAFGENLVIWSKIAEILEKLYHGFTIILRDTRRLAWAEKSRLKEGGAAANTVALLCLSSRRLTIQHYPVHWLEPPIGIHHTHYYCWFPWKANGWIRLLWLMEPLFPAADEAANRAYPHSRSSGDSSWGLKPSPINWC